MISKKIVIGTANFGMKYGLDKNKLYPDEIKKIFNYCKKERINSLDTAPGYKKSLENLKKNEIENWEIISKISSLPLHVKDVNSYVKKVFFTTLKKLDLQKIHTILIHDENDILNISRGKKIPPWSECWIWLADIVGGSVPLTWGDDGEGNLPTVMIEGETTDYKGWTFA